MAVTRTAKRALKKSLRNKERNYQKKEEYKKLKKEFLKSLVKNDIEVSKKQLGLLYKKIDKMAKIHLIHKNKASREKSQLAKKLVNKINELSAKNS
ncbi:MAG: 30S ribosomal protein S20 [Minisyncoccia bacterium]|jgi:small subunit ribosomal protein S20